MQVIRVVVALGWLAACAQSEVGPHDAAPADAAAEDAANVDAAEPPVDAAPPPVDAPALAEAIIVEPGFPLIHNHSHASRAHILVLVRRALDGLGFDPASGEGPNHRDRVFIGDHYVAWIDQTGFHGKMNGLWALDGAGDALDFIVADADGRPVNVFVPGEDGEGTWPKSYKGAEHVEFPNRVVETGDSCGGDWCNQYSLDEAPRLDNPRIQHWTACNAGAIGFDALYEPTVVQTIAGGIKLVYEGRLVKEADGDGNYDGDHCHEDYLFPDGVRRPVYLRLGYELRGTTADIERTMQLYNPPGNPTLAGDMSLIGGFVMTGWPAPHYLKRFQRFWRPETREVNLRWGDADVLLRPGVWNDLSALVPVDRDVLIGWIDQPVSVSATAGYGPGIATTLAHVGPVDNADVGACLCTVHGGLELGGGLVHAGISLPIAAGQATPEGRRRLTLYTTGAGPTVHGQTLEAETLAHAIGHLDTDGWAASTAGDVAGHLVYGPYATDWGGGSAQVAFHLLVDNNTAANDVVVTIEVNDATADRILSSRLVRRHEFRAAHQYQRFTIDVDLTGRAGHRMETRVFWHDVSFVKLDKVVLDLADAP
jgi:hypothetical protein